MMSAVDWERQRADLMAIRGDNAVSIVIRRGNTTLAAQTVRIARKGVGRSRRQGGEGVTEAAGAVTMLGDIDFNIQVDDRFTVAGILYRVSFVYPNKRAATQAEAEAIQ